MIARSLRRSRKRTRVCRSPASRRRLKARYPFKRQPMASYIPSLTITTEDIFEPQRIPDKTMIWYPPRTT